MKLWKQIDAWVQLLLIAASLALVISLPGSHFFAPYFVVGGWQFLSIVVHDISRSFTVKGSARNRYHVTTYIAVALMLLSYFFEPFLLVFAILLFAAPLMAAYYLALCFREIQSLQKRPLSQLK
ncbi:hypothetical protein [Foetidibacter luteolus]|uniref:hypothetical protein n=1 Tax=Foetidibacter luteolus TaxID=2608880 RepID=UPI00129B6DB9|nr:hypothetical protein [Foetidibacter luteolus]